MSFRQPATPEGVVLGAKRDPVAFGQALIKEAAERRLIDFVRLMWKVLDPGTPLRIGWAMEAICEHLEAVSNGQIINLLINVPPGFSKSLCTDTFWPMWEWGPRNRPDLRYLSWSYAEQLTKINNTKARDLIRSPLYRALWGDRFQISKDQDEKTFYKNTAGGFKLASSITGVGTGLRGDRLILDDPHSVDGADSDAIRDHAVSWFGGTMTSRVRNPNNHAAMVQGVMVLPSATVIIMQRTHRKDIAGVILDQGLGFHHLIIEMEYEGTSHPARRTLGYRPMPGYVDARQRLLDMGEKLRSSFRKVRAADDYAMFCEGWTNLAAENAKLADADRFSRVAVDAWKARMRNKMGSNAVASQLRQWPHEGEGTLFRREWFKYLDPSQVPPPGRDDCRGWDLAATESAGADATATVKMRMDAKKRIYILHAEAVRKSPGAVEDYIREVANADGDVIQNFPQDPGAAGKHLVTHLARVVLQGKRFRSSPEMRSKIQRAEPLSAQFEHGNVFVVRGPWNSTFLAELEEFPHGMHDDLVDAASRAYATLIEQQESIEPVAPKLFVGRV